MAHTAVMMSALAVALRLALTAGKKRRSQPVEDTLASRGRSARFAFLLASLLAVILEFLQIPIAGRTFDLGEAGLGAFGALAGAWAFHRIFPAAPRSNGGAIAERQAIGHSGPP